MDKMDVQFAETCEKFALLKKGNSVLVALSGGPDSVALLHMFCRLKGRYGITLSAAHLDHGIRPGSSADREFCKDLCRKLQIKFYSKKTNIPAISSKQKLSSEEAGRKTRYDYFEALSEKYGFTLIATGHTSDDNAETVIFNIARGSGLAGLAGIPPKRGKIIRPLIEMTKKDIVNWLKKNKIAFKIDPSNRSLKYARNRIRHTIIPQLEELNSGAVGNILKLSRNISEDIELIDSLTVSAYEDSLVRAGKSKIVLDLAKLNDYDIKLRKNVVTRAFRGLSEGYYKLSFDAISRAEMIISGRSGAGSHLGDGIWIEKSKYHVSVFRPPAKKTAVRLKVPGSTAIPFSDLLLRSEVYKRSEIRRLKTEPVHALLDKELIPGGTVRFWKNGDKIRPFGMRGRRLLSDIFSERGVPAFERGGIPLLVSGGSIAWIAGVMISEDFKVGVKTKKVLSVKLCEQS